MTAQTRLLLTLLAGYCDTVTFVHMHGIFSAHVTGNFVLFAAAMGRGLEPSDYLKLWTFPVFIAAVMLATGLYLAAEKARALGKRSSGLTRVLGMMALTLIVAVGIAFVAPATAWDYQADIAITMLVVLAMGLQNALHHFIPGAMTTVMTGTVMNTVAKFTKTLLGHKPDPAVVAVKAVNPFWMILLFGGGCLAGGFAARDFAFQSLLIPAACCCGLWLWECSAVQSKSGAEV